MTFFFVAGASLGGWFPRIPEVQRGLDLSNGELGVALIGPAVGSLLAMPSTGWFIARRGSRWLTTLAALVLCLALPLPTLAPNLPALILALVLLGGANGVLDVAMNVQAVAVEERYRRPIMSAFHAVFSVGTLAGAATAGIVAGWGIGPTTHLVAAGLLLAVVAIAASRRLLPAGTDDAGDGPAFSRPSRALAKLGVVAFCVLVGEGAMADWSAVYLRNTLGTTDAFAAAGYAAFAGAMVVGRFAGDRLTARLGPVRVVRGGGILVVIGLGLGLVVGQPWSALIGFAAVGAGLSCAFPVILSAAGRTPGLATGAAIAAVATVGYTGFLAGPPVIGFAAELAGLRAGLGVVVLLGVAMIVLAGAVGRGTENHAEAIAASAVADSLNPPDGRPGDSSTLAAGSRAGLDQ